MAGRLAGGRAKWPDTGLQRTADGGGGGGTYGLLADLIDRESGASRVSASERRARRAARSRRPAVSRRCLNRVRVADLLRLRRLVPDVDEDAELARRDDGTVSRTDCCRLSPGPVYERDRDKTAPW